MLHFAANNIISLAKFSSIFIGTLLIEYTGGRMTRAIILQEF